MSFFAELKRRNVFRVGIAYVVGGWLIAQVVELAADSFGAPDWFMKMLLTVLALGLPVVLFFAWAFEITPEGVKRERDVDRSQSIKPTTGKKLNNAILVLMALAIGYLLFDRFSGPTQPGSDQFSQQTAGQTIDTNEKSALTPVETIAQVNVEEEPAISKKSIAVLPFANRSNLEEDQFFTDGIHDDLLTTIARIGSMKVISRTSVMEYKDTTKKIPEIAAELGVANILEGGIQRSGDQVRINVQLIDANTDEHLWAEIFDRELTAENLFAIQSEISQAIANALHATLSPEETRRINSTPTDNLQAYDAYLRGRQLIGSRLTADIEQAVEAFKKAVALDPGFALAWVGVADSHLLLSIYGTLEREKSMDIRKDAIERALAIDTSLGEAYASLGTLLQNQNQPKRAEEAYLKAIELNPNYATAWQWYSSLLQAFPRRSQEALETTRKAVELDPRSMIIGKELGDVYADQGLYTLAERQYQKVHDLHPDSPGPLSSLARMYLFSIGRFDKAVATQKKAIELDPHNITLLMLLAIAYTELGDMDSANLARIQIENVDNQHWTLDWTDKIIANASNNPAATLEAIKRVQPKSRHSPRRMQIAARNVLGLGDASLAREIYLTANSGWLDPDQWRGLMDKYVPDACVFSWVLIKTGDEQLGRQLLDQMSRYLEVELAAVNEHVDSFTPELCYLTAGDTEKALASIETQLAHNHLYHWPVSHRMPMYDLIRDEPRYQAALQERERIVAAQRESLESGAAL